MKPEISVPEAVNIFREIKEPPDKLYEMIRTGIRETTGQYLSSLMDAELAHFLGRKRCERLHGDINHGNGSYERSFTLKGQVRLIFRFRETAGIILRQRQFLKAGAMKMPFAGIYV